MTHGHTETAPPDVSSQVSCSCSDQGLALHGSCVQHGMGMCQQGTSKMPPNRRERHLFSCHLISAPGCPQHMPTITLPFSVQDRH